MKLQDKETLSIASTVANVLEGKKEVKEVKFPHKMYHPDTGESVDIKTEEEHDKYTAKGWVHEKPAVKEVDEPKAKGEKEFKDKHTVKKSGMNNDGSVTKEEVELEEGLSASDLKKAQAIVNDPKTKGGNMTQAIKDLEKWKKGSSDDKKVSQMLRVAHESANEATISETTVKTSILDDWDGPGNIQTYMKKMAKEFKVKATFKNGAGNGTAGPDLAMFTGKDEDLIKFVNEFFGSVKNTKELKAWSENVKNEKRKFKFQKEEVTISVLEAHLDSLEEAKKAGRGKSKVDIDWIGDKKQSKDAEKKHKVKIKPTGRSTADVSGEKKSIVALLSDPDVYGMDQGDIEDLFPELFEAKLPEYSSEDEMSPKQKKYQAFFNKALKKFGVKSPQELEGDKRKEFFDYIDANWKGDNESD